MYSVRLSVLAIILLLVGVVHAPCHDPDNAGTLKSRTIDVNSFTEIKTWNNDTFVDLYNIQAYDWYE